MARYSEHDTSRIYEAVDVFRNDCLLRIDSLLFEHRRPELLAINFLFPSNIGGFHKQQVADEVLAWTGNNLPETHLFSRWTTRQ